MVLQGKVARTNRFAGVQSVGRTYRFAGLQRTGRTFRFAQTGESADSPICKFWTFVQILTMFAGLADLKIWRTPRTHTQLCVRESVGSENFLLISCVIYDVECVFDSNKWRSTTDCCRSDDFDEDSNSDLLSLSKTQLSLSTNLMNSQQSSTNLMFFDWKMNPLRLWYQLLVPITLLNQKLVEDLDQMD